jgi:cobalt-zinc-cadmium efflux system outer membrane protein
MIKRLLPALALLAPLHVAPALAQPPSAPASPPPDVAAPAPPEMPKLTAQPAGGVPYRAYLTRVAQGNLDLVVQRASVSIADAQVDVARIFPDLVLTAGAASVDVSHKGAPSQTTVGLGVTVELGGKRGARVAVAESGRAGARADLDDALRTLRGTATGAFIDALHARAVLERRKQTQTSLDRLVTINEDRARAGDIGKVALAQSKVEAQRFRGEVVTAEADAVAANLALAVHTGIAQGQAPVPIVPAGDLRIKPRAFQLEDLLATARANRPDLASKRHAAAAANARADLARANRWVDLTFNVGWQHNFPSYTDPFKQPAFEAMSATVSVPIPFSKVYRGELDAALAGQSQTKAQVQSAELKVEVEVRQLFVRYKAAVDKAALYTGGLLEGADQVLDATLYNYQRAGGATMLEVLEAQRTVNEVYLGYYQALAEQARALVALEEAVGIWDVDL